MILLLTITTGFGRLEPDENYNRSAADMDAYNYMYNISYVSFNCVHCGQGLFIICFRGMSGLVSLRACVAMHFLRLKLSLLVELLCRVALVEFYDALSCFTDSLENLAWLLALKTMNGTIY